MSVSAATATSPRAPISVLTVLRLSKQWGSHYTHSSLNGLLQRRNRNSSPSTVHLRAHPLGRGSRRLEGSQGWPKLCFNREKKAVLRKATKFMTKGCAVQLYLLFDLRCLTPMLLGKHSNGPWQLCVAACIVKTSWSLLEHRRCIETRLIQLTQVRHSARDPRLEGRFQQGHRIRWDQMSRYRLPTVLASALLQPNSPKLHPCRLFSDSLPDQSGMLDTASHLCSTTNS